MDVHREPSWPREDMVPPDLDFSSILAMGDDLEGASFQLPELDPNMAAGQFAVQQPNTPFANGDLPGMHRGAAAHGFAQPAWDMSMDIETADMLGHQNASRENMQQFQQQMGQPIWATPQQQPDREAHMGNMVYRHPTQIPPTPNSYEMHGADAAQYRRHMAQQRAFLDQQMQQQIHMNQAKPDSLTPLMSPAGTPHESGAVQHHSDYGGGNYFTPLSSPAMQAQNANRRYRKARSATQPSTAGSSAATSPVNNDQDVDMETPEGRPDRARKPTKKATAARSVGSRSGVRSSPIAKAQKRKSAALSASLTSQDLGQVLQDPHLQQINNSLRASTNSTDGSGTGSISPEPLSEPLMGPPPRPASNSTMQSPPLYAQAQHPQQALLRDGNAPATPASLMSIDNPRNVNARMSTSAPGGSMGMASLENSHLDDFALPPAIANNTAIDSAAASARMNSARKTPKLGPMTSATGRSSATSSPAISAMTSPTSATTPAFPKDVRSRQNKKRSSTSGSSHLISPALRPKISPNIKPLLPDGTHVADQTQTYLLASKSNYTHLLEGTLLPGVSYPDSLSSGLTSKRTSHKIAEQGRRNRINEALKEMQALLPPPAIKKTNNTNNNGNASECEASGATEQETKDEEAGPSPSEDNNSTTKNGKDLKTAKAKARPNPNVTASTNAAAEAKAANSKAATVESAIVYIKTLLQERSLMAEQIKHRDEEVSELRRRLKEVEFRASPSLAGDDTQADRSEEGSAPHVNAKETEVS